ncbi:DUF2807 domain-containing protein [Aquimarina sp. U1-2]|uniref:head GIN domain-containing protein n=1 Tax=Aquimarina sp. U1-2 TaxID=2823141 RepID=UPI001AECABD3|nr:head GIN domain-containing protein [Aquimarina sp. U1-2]MBP2833737.1 DUF2807 domain-containing protein [Aquimarina sp. U1-2]
MKKLLFIIGIVAVMGCDSENALDCFQRTGATVRQEIEVQDFSRILVNPNIELILKQGDTTAVSIETGDNLLNDVSVIVDGDRLILNDSNDCAFFRAINPTKVFVTAPNITQIRSATQFDISSDGVLNYPSLSLLSEDFNEDTGTTTGTFNLRVNAQNIAIVANNITSFFIEGVTESLSVNFASGIGRFEGGNLIAQKVSFFHRGANKIIVHPIESLQGELRSTGDLIAVNTPPVVEVEQFFTGRLLFE